MVPSSRTLPFLLTILAGLILGLFSGMTFNKILFKPYLRSLERPQVADVVVANSTTRSNNCDTRGIPMYYINLDRSPDRRKLFEDTFESAGTIHRIAAADYKDPVNVLSRLATYDETVNASVALDLAASDLGATPGEISLVVSHVEAISTAWKAGDQLAIIMEDDVSPVLCPFWTMQLDELAELANEKFPDWGLIRLQFTFQTEGAFKQGVAAWKADPVVRLVPANSGYWGTVSYMINRKGMFKILKALDQNFDKPKDKVSLTCSKGGSGCVSDYTLYGLLSGEESILVQPPMYTVRLSEKYTGIRDSQKTGTQIKRNRPSHSGYHEQSAVDSFRFAVEVYEHKVASDAAAAVGEESETGMLRVPVTRWKVYKID